MKKSTFFSILISLSFVLCSCGEKNGPFKTFYDNGQLKTEGVYKNGFPYGLLEEYYENGQLKMTLFYVENGQLEMEQLYDKNGQLEEESLFNKNGQLEVKRIYHGDGTETITSYNYE